MSNTLSIGSGRPFWHIGDLLPDDVTYPWRKDDFKPWAPIQPNPYSGYIQTIFTGGTRKVSESDKKVIQLELLLKIAKETKMDMVKFLTLMEEILNG